MMRVSNLRVGNAVTLTVAPSVPINKLMGDQPEVPSVTASEQARAQTGQERQARPEDLRQAVEDMNRTVQMIDERLEFKVHEATNTVMVKVVDQWTKQVIKEIPPEKFLDLVAKLQELAGLFVDQRV